MTTSIIILIAVFVVLTLARIPIGICRLAGGLSYLLHKGMDTGVAAEQVMNAMLQSDVLLAIPQIILAIAIVGALGTSLVNLLIAVGISQLPRYARVVRASALTVRGQEFVEAARAVGARDVRIIVENILPNCMAPIIVQSRLFCPPPPSRSWGWGFSRPPWSGARCSAPGASSCARPPTCRSSRGWRSP